MAQTTVPGALAGAAAQVGGPGGELTDEQVRAFVREQLAAVDLDGRSVCVLVPDGTRSCPVPLLLGAVHEALHGRVSRLTVLVALGTHARMGDAALARHLGYPLGAAEDRYPGTAVLNHTWWDPDTFVSVGSISADRLAELSEGRFRHQSVEVRLNRAVVEHDVTLVVGPVFPHEVVGFSGGNKYFFPGISSQEVINVSHWLGALITSAEIIGTRGITPVRALIDEAVSLVPCEKLAFCVVVQAGSRALHSVAFGEPRAAWAAAADVAAETHVRYLDAPVRRVLSVIPGMYHDIWTAAKGFYKVEPVVADGGEVVIYAPHVREVAATEILAPPRWQALETADDRRSDRCECPPASRSGERPHRFWVGLVAPHTVNTVPEPALRALAESARSGDTIRGTYVQAHTVFEDLRAVGIDFDDVVATWKPTAWESPRPRGKELLDWVSGAMAGRCTQAVA